MGINRERTLVNSGILSRFSELGGMMAPKILVIEDSATFRALLTATLRHKGYEVVGAETGLSGTRAAKKEMPNVISLDLSLPDVSGIEVLSLLKEDITTRQIPVIICTACVDGGLREEVLQNGAAEILTKPVQPAHLFAALDRQLRPISKEGATNAVCESINIG